MINRLNPNNIILLAHALLDPFTIVQTEPEAAPLKFSQVFHLMPVGSSFVVTNGEAHVF